MRAMYALATLFLASALAAQAPADFDAFYKAIRNNDLAALRTLVRAHGVDATDAQGHTVLMLAAGYGTPDAMKEVLRAGADVRAKATSGVTALHWAVTSLEKTRMLLDAGADVNAPAPGLRGRTPLLSAAAMHGNANVVRLLVANGADVNAAEADTGLTAVIAAANVNDAEVVRFLISRGVDPAKRSAAEGVANPLFGAARNGNVQLMRTLLERKVDVNAASADYGAKVTNGRVQFGRITPLHMAVVSGEPDAVRLLLDAGARVDPADIRGMTPLMFAVATDRPQPRIIRMLLDAGASTTVRSKADENVIDWARKFNNPAVLSHFGLVSVTAHRPNTAALDGPRQISTTTLTSREAVERSLPLLRSSSARMMSNGGCVACHAQPLTGLAVGAALAQGWTSEAADTQISQVTATANAFTADYMVLRDAGGRPDSLLYSLFFLAAEDTPPNRATDAIVRFVAAKQRKEGNWGVMGGTRAPMQDGDVSRTALAIRALTAFGSPAARKEYAQRVTRAAGWLTKLTPVSTEQRVMQLLGLHWADTGAKLRQTGVKALLAEQRPDGGWGQTPYLGSDAYATGQVLYALRELDVPATDAALQRGAAFLRRTQAPDGSWHVTNRAMKVQPYFDGGFPYDHDQWISQAATAWAVMGLARTDVTPSLDLVATARR